MLGPSSQNNFIIQSSSLKKRDANKTVDLHSVRQNTKFNSRVINLNKDNKSTLMQSALSSQMQSKN